MLSDIISEFKNKKRIIETIEAKTGSHTTHDKQVIINMLKDLKRYNQGFDLAVAKRADIIQKELIDITKLQPSAITTQKTKINEKIDQLNTLLSNSKNKIISKK
jgi:hypothetical protein